MPEPVTPTWVHDAIFYQIFPDRFAQSTAVARPNYLEPWDSPPTVHGFKGGDLYGIAERLDYLQDLGITAIYMTPIFQSAANHRYHTYDYYAVDPILGGNAALQALMDAAHARGMRVVLDGVFNHASRGFFQFHHVLENGQQSPYVDWWHIHGFPLRAYEHAFQYRGWYNLPQLPKFNTHTPAVRAFLLDVAEHWVRRGIDGWRLDVPNEINDDSFWQEFRTRVKRINPDCYIVGEIWEESRRWLQGDQFDAVMNYLFTGACIGFFVRNPDLDLIAGTGLAKQRPLTGQQFAQAIEALLGLYHPSVTLAQLNLLDSHDTARFLTIARGDPTAFELATLFQMTYPGAPSIYYGDEVGMEGGRDPDCRRAFIWDPSRWNHTLRSYVQQAIALRKAYPALRRGAYISLYADDTLYVFARALDEQRLVIALNTAETSRSVRMPAGMLPRTTGLELVFGAGMAHMHAETLMVSDLRPRSGAVFRCT